MFEKLKIFFFFKWDKKNGKIWKFWDIHVDCIEKTLNVNVSDFWLLSIFYPTWKKRVLLFHDFHQKSNFLKNVAFQLEKYCLANFVIDLGSWLVNTIIFFMIFSRALLVWLLLFCKTYKFTCNMWCVMCDAWYVSIQTWFFVRFCFYDPKGDQKCYIFICSPPL